MPANPQLNGTVSPAVIDSVSFYICQALIFIQLQHPECLTEKYRNFSWQEHQSAFTTRLAEVLSQVETRDTLMLRVKQFLQVLFIPSFFDSQVFIDLIERVSQFTQPGPDLQGGQLSHATQSELAALRALATSMQAQAVNNIAPFETEGIAVLLLDAETLQLDVETEKFLTTICTFPIQGKIALGNWRSLGEWDRELSQRGYDLIHIPDSKDIATQKIVAIGAALRQHYFTAKEVFVCSSDEIMVNLYAELQQQNLITYLVSKQGENVIVANSKTGRIETYSLKPTSVVPSIEACVNQLKELIKAEQEQTGRQWVSLSQLLELFEKTYDMTVEEILAVHAPGISIQELFMHNPASFVVHQISAQTDLYVTLFEVSESQSRVVQND